MRLSWPDGGGLGLEAAPSAIVIFGKVDESSAYAGIGCGK